MQLVSFYLFSSSVIVCSEIPSIEHAVVSYDKGSNNSRPVGTVATYTCDNGFNLSEWTPRICQNDKTWFGSSACEREGESI